MFVSIIVIFKNVMYMYNTWRCLFIESSNFSVGRGTSYLALQCGAWLTWACLTVASVIPSCSARVIPSCSFTFARVIPTLLSFFVKTFLVTCLYYSINHQHKIAITICNCQNSGVAEPGHQLRKLIVFISHYKNTCT